jgi:hypothetical protein
MDLGLRLEVKVREMRRTLVIDLASNILSIEEGWKFVRIGTAANAYSHTSCAPSRLRRASVAEGAADAGARMTCVDAVAACGLVLD